MEDEEWHKRTWSKLLLKNEIRCKAQWCDKNINILELNRREIDGDQRSRCSNGDRNDRRNWEGAEWRIDLWILKSSFVREWNDTRRNHEGCWSAQQVKTVWRQTWELGTAACCYREGQGWQWGKETDTTSSGLGTQRTWENRNCYLARPQVWQPVRGRPVF